MTKVDIISGFLGAGKTTLISKLLKEALKGEQVVLIENEFGEIGIGGKFIEDGELFIKVSNDKAYHYNDKRTVDFDEGYVVDSIVAD